MQPLLLVSPTGITILLRCVCSAAAALQPGKSNEPQPLPDSPRLDKRSLQPFFWVQDGWNQIVGLDLGIELKQLLLQRRQKDPVSKKCFIVQVGLIAFH